MTDINETAVTIASTRTGVSPKSCLKWITESLNGRTQPLKYTAMGRVLDCYHSAVAMAELSKAESGKG